jgi:hypothetical protein
MLKQFTTSKIAIVVILALTDLQANAANLSELEVVKEAANTGLWILETGGMFTDGTPVPKKTETICATKEEALKAFDQAIMYDNKTGKESAGCPTTITTNSSNLGIASMICPANNLTVGGQTINIPEVKATVEIKKLNANQWNIKFGTMNSKLTYQGSATKGCVATR